MKNTALILGGSGLIGSKVIKKLLNNNYLVINLDLKKQSFNHNDLTFFKFDIKNSKKFSDILKKVKKIDVYINSSYPTLNTWKKCNVKQINEKIFHQNISIHLKSYIWFTKIVADKMSKNKNGSIVLMNSIYGILGQDINNYFKTNIKENLVYTAVKGSITNSVKQFASLYSPNGVRVNSVISGGVNGHNHSTNDLNLPKKFISNYTKKTPLKRLANAEEIASAIYFLASTESSYITGSNLLVDGGYSAI